MAMALENYVIKFQLPSASFNLVDRNPYAFKSNLFGKSPKLLRQFVCVYSVPYHTSHDYVWSTLLSRYITLC